MFLWAQLRLHRCVFISNLVHRCTRVTGKCMRHWNSPSDWTSESLTSHWFTGGVGRVVIHGEADMERMKGGVHWEGRGLFGISDKLERLRQDRTCRKTRRNVGACAHAQLIFYKSVFALCMGCFGTRVENSFMSRWNWLLWLCFQGRPLLPPCMRTLGHIYYCFLTH